MAAGDLASADALSALDTGLYVGNLWYLNFSDRPACRLTGMTRFASFWVEGGKIVAPVNVMRFDDSVFRLLGEQLVGLTAERELLVNGDTYRERNVSSMRLPGAVVRDMAFTLEPGLSRRRNPGKTQIDVPGFPGSNPRSSRATRDVMAVRDISRPPQGGADP